MSAVTSYAFAQSMVAAGLSLIPCSATTKLPISYLLPIKRDAAGNPILNPKTGKPKHTWEPFQRRLPNEEELYTWFQRYDARPAVVYGAISGNAEVIDHDKPASGDADQFFAWYDMVQRQAPDLAERLCVVRTPSGAHHVPYRCPTVTIPSHHVLAAQHVIHATDLEQDRSEVLIETRGEGGYALCPPGEGYAYMRGSHLDLPVLTASERDMLHELARQFSIGAPRPRLAQPPCARTAGYQGDTSRPGDDYSRQATIADVVRVLCRHGWQEGPTGADGRVELTRPGKDSREGTSGDVASIDGRVLFTQFSSNGGPFLPKRGHSAFTVLTMLEYHGDARIAAKALAAQGYGTAGHVRYLPPAPIRVGVPL